MLTDLDVEDCLALVRQLQAETLFTAQCYSGGGETIYHVLKELLSFSYFVERKIEE